MKQDQKMSMWGRKNDYRIIKKYMKDHTVNKQAFMPKIIFLVVLIFIYYDVLSIDRSGIVAVLKIKIYIL